MTYGFRVTEKGDAKGCSDSSFTAAGDQVELDHVTAQIKRLQGASYPVHTGSHPVSVTSLTDFFPAVSALFPRKQGQNRHKARVKALSGSGDVGGHEWVGVRRRRAGKSSMMRPNRRIALSVAAPSPDAFKRRGS